MFDFNIEVADKVIRFKSDDPASRYDASGEREFKHFLCRNSRDADIVFDIKYGTVPDFSGKEILFNVDRNRALSRFGEKILFEYPDRSLEGRMERVAEINDDMREGIIYVNREKTPEEKEESKRRELLKLTKEERAKREASLKRWRQIRALRMAQRESNRAISTLAPDKPEKERPREKTPEELWRNIMFGIKTNFFQAFFIEYLVKHKIGFLVHCSSVQNDKKLYIFMGQSRTGKSTIAELWHDKVDATIFNDDRAVITMQNGIAYFYNTPWVGALMDKCDLSSGNKTKIDSISFLYHSDSNILKKLSRAEAAPKIFRNSFPVFWKKDALNFVIEKCSEIASSVPCYDLGFINNESVITFLKNRLKEEVNEEMGEGL